MYSYPHTITNGAGETLTFTRRVPGRTGPRVEGHNEVAPGVGVPMHVHHLQEEALTVRTGCMGYQRLGEPERFATVGETVVFAAGEAHRFWNAGSDVLRCDAYVEPADNVEYYLTEVFASQRRNGGRRPGLFDAAFLARRYRHEFGLLEVPAAVQATVFPVLALFGRLLGKQRRYAGAPAPVRRHASVARARA